MNLRTRTAKTTLAAAIAASAALGVSFVGGTADASTTTAVSPAADSSATPYGRPSPVATVPAIAGGSTAVALDSGFTDALTQLGLTPTTDGDATLDGGTITFPITGGTATLYDSSSAYRPYVQGVLFHQGSGLSLTAGKTKVSLDNFVIDPGEPARLFGDVSVNGKLAVASAPLFDLDGSTLEAPSTDSDGNTVLSGTQVKISPEAAALLNSTFKTDAVAGGLLVGTSTITLETS